jgi:hypothetical protein
MTPETQAPVADPSSASRPTRPFKWGFASVAAIALVVITIGEMLGRLIEDLPYRLSSGAGTETKDFLVLAFLLCSAGWVFFSRKAVLRFFRSMHAAVVLVSLSCLAVLVGVLVPQIDGFEDPEQRVTSANYEEQYSAFRWAEGYFFYHLLNLYGMGMPDERIPPVALESLDRFGNKYGSEERDNRLKRMEAAFTGQAKTREIREWIVGHDDFLRKFFDVSTFMSLNRTYKSHWFKSLLYLLAVAVALNTFTGKPKSWVSMRRVGHFVTHLGILTMLFGGAISDWKTSRGILHLDLREAPKNVFWEYYDPNKKSELPFYVGLERFARKEWMQLQIDFRKEGFTSRPPTYTLWPGKVINLDFVAGDGGVMRPRTRVEVLELYDQAAVDVGLREAAPGDEAGQLGAIAQFHISAMVEPTDHPDHPGHDQHAPQRIDQELARMPSVEAYRTFVDPAWEFRVATNYGEEQLDELLALFPGEKEFLGKLYMRDQAGIEVGEDGVAIALGDQLTAPGGYTIDVREAVADYVVDQAGVEQRDPRPIAEQYPSNPAVVVYITPVNGGEVERRVVRQNIDPVSMGLQAKYVYSDLVLFLDWDDWTAPGPERYILHWGRGSDPMLVSSDGTVTNVVLGEALPIAGETSLTPLHLYQNAMVNKDVTFEAPHEPTAAEVDTDFYSKTHRGMVVEITRDPGTPDASSEVVRMVTDEGLGSKWRDEDQALELTFFENTAMMPFEWRSVLSIWQPDPQGKLEKIYTGSERDSEIRVNDYFYWQGYRFFQTNANAEFPNYSGIGVVYDPGIPIVLAGMYTIIAGAVLAFIVRPIVQRRRKLEVA